MEYKKKDIRQIKDLKPADLLLLKNIKEVGAEFRKLLGGPDWKVKQKHRLFHVMVLGGQEISVDVVKKLVTKTGFLAPFDDRKNLKAFEDLIERYRQGEDIECDNGLKQVVDKRHAGKYFYVITSQTADFLKREEVVVNEKGRAIKSLHGRIFFDPNWEHVTTRYKGQMALNSPTS